MPFGTPLFAGNAASSGTSPGAITIPAGASVGDEAYLAITQSGSQPITVSGWTAVPGAQGTVSTTLRTTLYTRTLQAGDPGSTVTVTFGGSQISSAAIITIPGAGALDGSVVVLTKTVASLVTPFSPVTPSGNDEMIIYVAGSRAGTVNTPVTHGEPANYTEGIDQTQASGNVNRNGTAIGYRVLVGGSGAPEDPPDVALSPSGTDVTMTFAVTLAAAGTYSASGSGSSATGGAATASMTLAAAGTGGSSTAGTAAATATLAAAGTGTSTTGGAAAGSATLAAGGAGSSSTGGAAAAAATLAAASTGTSATGGSAAAALAGGTVLPASASGGSSTGGTAAARIVAAFSLARLTGGTGTAAALAGGTTTARRLAGTRPAAILGGGTSTRTGGPAG